jgi:hypothetical protein
MATGLASKDLAATGETDWLQVNGDFNISVDMTTGSGVGTVVLQRSFDGVNAKPAAVDTYTGDTEEVGNNPERIWVRLKVTDYTSGTISLRLSY